MDKKPRLLICEDHEPTQEILKDFLGKKNNFDVTICSSGEEFLEKLNDSFTVLLVDVKLPGIDGVEVLRISKEKLPHSPVIMMTAHSSENLILSCMREGAYNYIRKPFNFDSLKTSIIEANDEYYSNALSVSDNNITKEFTSLNKQVIDLNNKIAKLATKNITILLQGETGTGKEYYAQMIHKLRNEKSNFVAVNCPAIPKELAESEIFGHEKGSFTGANEQRIGKLEHSDGGILFLDEIADLDMNIQNKLLRSLQERTLYRVGSNKEIKFDSLVVSATSKNLKKLIEQGKFREDLYYRIADIELNIVPLRQRTEDIPMLVEMFANEYAKQNNEKAIAFSDEAIEMLKNYPWPGNLRELRSNIRKLSILSDSKQIGVADLPDNILDQIDMEIEDEIDPGATSKTLEGNEKQVILEVLKDCKYNLSKASKELGIGRSTLYRKIKKFGIEID